MTQEHGPSPHLTWTELACNDIMRSPYPDDYRRDGRVRPLALAFEAVRQACGGKPIRIMSAYRTVPYNAVVGGAANSQHVHGRALDLQTPLHLSRDDFHRIAQDVVRLVPAIGGLGLYDWGVHVDTRARVNDRPTVWDLRGER